MDVKDYLIVYGHNLRRGGSCYKETEINCDDLVRFMPIIKTIHDNIDKTMNWIGGITLERTSDGHYIEHNHLYEMYPQFDPKLLDELSEYLPDGITHIESIKIFSGQKIKII